MIEIYHPADIVRKKLRFHPAVDAWPINESGCEPEHHIALIRDEMIVARCSMWMSETASHHGQKTCYVGHLAGHDRSVLAELLSYTSTLKEVGRRTILAPIDGDTWHRYRVVIDHGHLPPFPLEPTNPPWWSGAFEDAGFRIAESYWSAARDLRRNPCGPIPDILNGVRVRHLDPTRLAEEINSIYGLAVQAFAANPLYTPVGFDTFQGMYEPIASRIDPGFCLIAETSTPVGVMLAIPADEERLVLKTIAVDTEHRGIGLGQCLLASVARRGQDLGFTQLIYALMHDENRSSEIVRRLAEPMRRYALYAYGGDA